ncbi:hypothetical protein [Bacillus solimangrovi]|nr:hypothetical protein [Bacillus solimangrovi]
MQTRHFYEKILQKLESELKKDYTQPVKEAIKERISYNRQQLSTLKEFQ